MRKTMCLRLAALSWVAMAVTCVPVYAQYFGAAQISGLEATLRGKQAESRVLESERQRLVWQLEALERSEAQEIRALSNVNYIERSEAIRDRYRPQKAQIEQRLRELNDKVENNSSEEMRLRQEIARLQADLEKKQLEYADAEKKRRDELDRQAEERKAKSDELNMKTRDAFKTLGEQIASRQQDAKDKAEARRAEEEREWNERQEAAPPSPPPDTGGSSRYGYDDVAEDFDTAGRTFAAAERVRAAVEDAPEDADTLPPSALSRLSSVFSDGSEAAATLGRIEANVENIERAADIAAGREEAGSDDWATLFGLAPKGAGETARRSERTLDYMANDVIGGLMLADNPSYDGKDKYWLKDDAVAGMFAGDRAEQWDNFGAGGRADTFQRNTEDALFEVATGREAPGRPPRSDAKAATTPAPSPAPLPGGSSVPGYGAPTKAGGAVTPAPATSQAPRPAYPARTDWPANFSAWADRQAPGAAHYRPDSGGVWLHDGTAWRRQTVLPPGLRVPAPAFGQIEWDGRAWKGPNGEAVHWDANGLPRYVEAGSR